MGNKTRMIRISENVYNQLVMLRKDSSETFNDVIKRLLEHRACSPIEELAIELQKLLIETIIKMDKVLQKIYEYEKRELQSKNTIKYGVNKTLF